MQNKKKCLLYPLQELVVQHASVFCCLRLIDLFEFMVQGGADNEVSVYSLPECQKQNNLARFTGAVHSLSFDKEGNCECFKKR